MQITKLNIGQVHNTTELVPHAYLCFSPITHAFIYSDTSLKQCLFNARSRY